MMFTFFKRKESHTLSMQHYLTQDQKYLSWLNTIQREFEYNQKLLICLQQLKHLILLQSSDTTKRQYLEQFHLSPERINEFLKYSPQKISETIQNILMKQNEMSKEHHTYTHLREAIKISYLKP